MARRLIRKLTDTAEFKIFHVELVTQLPCFSYHKDWIIFNMTTNELRTFLMVKIRDAPIHFFQLQSDSNIVNLDIC